jgi:hypothetical protein
MCSLITEIKKSFTVLINNKINLTPRNTKTEISGKVVHLSHKDVMSATYFE